MKNIAVIGAGIVGICSAYFLKKSGFNVTLIDREQPGSITSFGHAFTFADYANVPVNYPGLIWDIPSMLLRKDGPLAVDFFYILKNLPWAISFLKNCKLEISIPSAQIKSGLILAALNTKGTSHIKENNITRNHTELMLKTFGADIETKKYGSSSEIIINGKK